MITTMMQCDEYQELRDDEQRQIDWEYEMECYIMRCNLIGKMMMSIMN